MDKKGSKTYFDLFIMKDNCRVDVETYSHMLQGVQYSLSLRNKGTRIQLLQKYYCLSTEDQSNFISYICHCCVLIHFT